MWGKTSSTAVCFSLQQGLLRALAVELQKRQEEAGSSVVRGLGGVSGDMCSARVVPTQFESHGQFEAGNSCLSWLQSAVFSLKI